MSTNIQTIETENKLATAMDFASADFMACMNRGDAEEFGGKVLADRYVDFRIAAITLSKSKKELLEGFEKDPEIVMDMLERQLDAKKFIEGLLEMNDSATARLMSVITTLVPESQED